MEEKKVLSAEMLEEINGGFAEFVDRALKEEELLAFLKAESKQEIVKIAEEKGLRLKDEDAFIRKLKAAAAAAAADRAIGPWSR